MWFLAHLDEPYYRHDLALVHDRGFGFHADMCAPGILELLGPVRSRGGTVLEIGCGSGALTKHLVAAGHEVHATDSSPAMLTLARERVPQATTTRLTMPDDPIPDADAIVSIGHPLSYLPDEDAIHRSLLRMAEALRPGGVLAVDICDLEWGRLRTNQPAQGRVGDDWAIITRFSLPSPERYVREITTFVRDHEEGSWRRDDERHENTLVDTTLLPGLLESRGLEAVVRPSFGAEELPGGLVALLARRPSPDTPPGV